MVWSFNCPRLLKTIDYCDVLLLVSGKLYLVMILLEE